MKKKIMTLLILLLAFVSSGCVGKGEYEELQGKNDKLINENEELKQEIDDLNNGAPRLFAQIELAYEATNYREVKSIFTSLEDRHPASEEFKSAKVIYDKIIELEETETERLRVLAEKEEKSRLASLNKLRKKPDDVSGITWYYNPYFTHYNDRNLVSVYMGENNDSVWLILMMSYYGDNWIFFENAYLSYEGNTIEIPFDRYDNKESDNSGGSVWEWIQVSVTSEQLRFLKKFAASKDAKVRFSGKYTKTRALGVNERKGLSDVINGYEVLFSEKK